MKPYNIIGFGVCGENEKYLENTLKEFKRLCDHTVIVGNNIDEVSASLIKSYGFDLWKDDRLWGKCQNLIKENAIHNLARYNPDWVITLDMDEVFDSQFNREEAEKLCQRGGLGWYFYIINLYEHGYSEEWSFWNNRMFKYQKPLKFADKALHCGLAPELHWRYSNHAPFLLKHYGLKDKVDRDRKSIRYAQFDPKAKYVGKSYYDFLLSRSRISVFDEKELHDKVSKEVKNYQFIEKAEMPKEKKYYYVKTPQGEIVDIPDYQLDETLSRKGFTKISDKPIVVGGGSVKSTSIETTPETITENIAECDVCGFIAKNENELKAHKQKHND